MSVTVAALQAIHVASLLPAARRFAQALRAPEKAQAERFRALLAATADSARARELGLRPDMSWDEWAHRVPVVTYDDLEPYVQRIAAGERGVLSSSKVLMLERSGGSTSTTKLVPYTRELLQAFGRATSPWLFDLHRRDPGLFGGRSYWSISHALRRAERTEGGVRIGLDDDSEYLGPLARRLVARMFAVPASVARAPSIDAWREATLLALLAADDLALVSVWSPTFLTELLGALERELDALAPRLAPARQRAVASACRAGFAPAKLWPRLRLVSCWCDAGARAFLPALRALLPGVRIQPKGLLATEGVVSIPWGEQDERGAAAALASHVLELRDVERAAAPPLRPWELREGGLYSPLLSAQNGFLRYDLRDLVRCTGFLARAPLLRFEGKLDRTADLCGEKVSEAQASEALARASQATGLVPRFAMLVPLPHPKPHYALLLEDAGERAAAFCAAVEDYLATGHHYAYARSLGQLAPMRAVAVERGWARYEAAAVAGGRKAGDVKPTPLEPRPFALVAFPELP